MKKFILLVIAFILFIPFMVNAENKYTITYDANDGTGRTKTIIYEKGDSLTLADNSIFNYLNDDVSDPTDDKSIFSWCYHPDCSNNGYTEWLAGEEFPKTSPIYTYVYGLDNAILYAKWDTRKDISDQLENIIVTGDAVSKNENDEYVIEKYKDFEIYFHFKEKRIFGIRQYSYYQLPKYFTDIIYDSSKKQLEIPTELPIRLSNNHIYNGSFYIKNDTLFVDYTMDGSSDSTLLHVGYVDFSIKYSVSYTKKIINGRELYGATILVMCNNNDEPKKVIESYPTGKIKVYYIDIDTNNEIYDMSLEEDVLGTKFSLRPIEIKDYTFIESSNQDIEFEEEEQIVYYKYKKEKPKVTDTLKNPNTGNSPLIIIIIIIIIILFMARKLINKKKQLT